VLTSTLSAGAYFVVMDGWSSSRGTYRLQITCPGGGRSIRGTMVCNRVVTGSTTGGTSSQGHSAPEHYYAFRSTITGRYTFDSCGSAFDTYVYVYNRVGTSTTGNFVGSSVASCDDCGPCGLRTVLTATLAANRNYIVVIDGFSSSNGAYRLIANCPTTPSPAPISAGTLRCNGVVTGTTVGGQTTVGHSAPERWYMFTAPSTGAYSFDSCGSAFDSYLHVYARGTNNVRGNLVATCDDCGPCGLRTVLSASLVAGGNYWVVVDGFSSNRGAYRLQTICPTRVTIQGTVGCGTVISGNSATGTNTVGNPAPEHWWRFQAPVTGSYIFNSCGSNYDTWVHIYRRIGTSQVSTRVSTCDDCGPCGTRTVLTSTLSAGAYFVVMDGWSSSRGTYRLQITCPGGGRSIRGTMVCNRVVTGSTTGGTSSQGHSAPEHYYAFRSTITGRYTFDSCGSAFDTYVYVYNRVGTSTTGNFVGSSVASCDDCGPCGLRTVLTATLAANRNYIVVIDGFSSSNGAYRLIANCPTTPSPAPISAGTLRCNGVVTGTTVGGQTTVGHSAPERWYQFTATSTGRYTFDSCGSGYDTYIHVYNRGASNVRGSLVGTCDDCGPCGLRTVLAVNLVGGRPYWVVMDGFSTRAGNYRLAVTCPSGTSTPSIQGNVACNGVTTGNSATGTNTVGNPAPEHWWRFTAPLTGVYTFNSCGSSYDTWVHIYNRSVNAVGNRVSTCDDCGPCGVRTVLSVGLAAGSYFVVMDGYSNSRGTYRLQISCPTGSFIRGAITCNRTVTGSTTGGTSIVGHAAPEHFFSFAAPVTGSYVFDSCGSSFDTYLSIYNTPTSGSASLLGNLVATCDDCGPCGLRTVLVRTLTRGNYIIVMDGFSTSNGNYRLTTTCPGTAGPASPPSAGFLNCTGQNSVVTGTTVGGTTSVGHAAPERWYMFVAPATGSYTFNSCGSGYDTWLHVFNRGAGNAVGTSVASCDDCGPCGLRTVLANVALVQGRGYWVVVDGFSTRSGSYRLALTCPSGSSGIPIQGNAACGQVLTGNSATGSNTVGNPAPEHWYRFTAPVNGLYTFNSCGSSYDTWVHIYNRTGTSNVPGSRVSTCDDCGPCGTRTVLNVQLSAGAYFVVMDGWANSRGLYRMSIACPRGAYITGSLTCNNTVTGTTAGASVSLVGHPAPEHFYTFTAPRTGRYTFDSCGSAFDTWLYLYRGPTSATALVGSQVVNCDDCGPCGTRTVLSANLGAGAYIVIMDGYGQGQGAYRLTTTCPGGTGTQPPAPAPAPISAGTLTCVTARTGTTVGGQTTVGHAAPERWYQFTAPNTGRYTFTTCGSSFDTYLHIYNRGANNVRGTIVSTCDDCGPCGLRTVLTGIQLTGGANYWVVVDGFSSSRGNYRLAVTCAGTAAPTAPTVPPVSAVGNGGVVACNQVATGDTRTGTNTVGHAAPEHWWSFIAPTQGTYTFDSCGSSYDTYVHVYNRLPNNSVGQLLRTCDDCGPCGLRTVLNVGLNPGTYYIVMDGFSRGAGSYRLRVSCPTNAFTVATLSCGATVTGNTANNQGGSTVGHAAPEDYYRLAAPYNGIYTFNTCGSGFDTFVHVYEAGSTSTNTTILGNVAATCDDCGPCGLRTVLSTFLAAGNYFVIVDGFSTASGAYRMTATCPTTNAPPPPLSGTLSCGSTVTGTTSGSSSTVGHAAPEDWFMLTANVSGGYVFNTCGSSYDTYIHVFRRTGAVMGRQVYSCDDCGPCGLRTVASVNLAIGTYYVVVDGFSTASGNYRMTTTCPTSLAPTATPTSAAPSNRPTASPTTGRPTNAGQTHPPSLPPSFSPTALPTASSAPTVPPTAPTMPPTAPVTASPLPAGQTHAPTASPVTPQPTNAPFTFTPTTYEPTTFAPTTFAPTTLSPAQTSASSGSDSGGGNNLMLIIIILVVVALLILAAAVVFMKSKGGAATAEPREAFHNPVYGDPTKDAANYDGMTSDANYTDMPIADEAPDGLYDDDGYLDTDGDNSGYMETAPAEDEDF